MALSMPPTFMPASPAQPATIVTPFFATQRPLPWGDLIAQVRGVMDAFDTPPHPHSTKPTAKQPWYELPDLY
jgi:hypothetical protein